jgi:hypothetical protein
VIETPEHEEIYQSITVNVDARAKIGATIAAAAAGVTRGNLQITSPGSPPGTLTGMEISSVVSGGFPSPSLFVMP